MNATIKAGSYAYTKGCIFPITANATRHNSLGSMRKRNLIIVCGGVGIDFPHPPRPFPKLLVLSGAKDKGLSPFEACSTWQPPKHHRDVSGQNMDGGEAAHQDNSLFTTKLKEP